MTANNIAVSASGLGKVYRIRTTEGGPDGTGRRRSSRWRDFAALADVSFEVARGEKVAVIGRNGAGKSTLLKILSRIITPTSGEARVRGRLAGLLEVGTGFHSELAGRENIYLNGALLGMSRAEIDAAFDDIVAFANIGAYLDTAVKHYSSGMYTRLAFAVAAHLRPDVFIVDEVLAVGDLSFRKKCVDHMRRMEAEGGTILFVSHNMALVSSLCTRAIVMEAGRIHTPLCDVSEAIAAYNRLVLNVTEQDIATRTDREGAGRVRFTKVMCGSVPGGVDQTVNAGQPLFVHMRLGACAPATGDFHISVTFVNEHSHASAFVSSANAGHVCRLSGGEGLVVLELPDFRFAPGTYTVDVQLTGSDGELQDLVRGAAFFRCELADLFANGTQVPDGLMCSLPGARWHEGNEDISCVTGHG